MKMTHFRAVVVASICAMFFAPNTALQAQQDYKSYALQLGAYNKVLSDSELEQEKKRFAKLEDVGYIYEQSYVSRNFTDPSRLYLGSYLGLHTANRILAIVKKRGFSNVYVVEEMSSANPVETGFFTIVQLNSVKTPMMSNFKTILDRFGEGYIQMAYGTDGKYKAFINCFKDGQSEDEMEDAKRFGYTGWKRNIGDVYKVKGIDTNPKPIKPEEPPTPPTTTNKEQAKQIPGNRTY